MEHEQTERNIGKIAKLIAGVGMIWVFMFVIGPIIEKEPMIKPLADFIDYRNIDASALYYTEIEEFSNASIFMDNSRKYNPSSH